MKTSMVSAEAMRFFVVAAAGLAFDIAIGWLLIALAGWSDAVAATVGFACATAANYVAHQLWTFTHVGQRLSIRRFIAFFGVVLLSLGTRLVVLSMLAPLFPGAGIGAPLRLGLAATASFLLTFALSRHFIFRQSR